MLTFPIDAGERDVRVEVAEAVYPVAAIHGAAVIFIERAFLRIERPSAGRTRVTLRPKAGAASSDELRALGGSFLNELLHQALRIEVGQQTDKLRELVIGKGIMAAEGGGGDGGGVSFAEDPLGIARPWEERFLGENNGGRS